MSSHHCPVDALLEPLTPALRERMRAEARLDATIWRVTRHLSADEWTTASELARRMGIAHRHVGSAVAYARTRGAAIDARSGPVSYRLQEPSP